MLATLGQRVPHGPAARARLHRHTGCGSTLVARGRQSVHTTCTAAATCSKVTLRTKQTSELGVSIYPIFKYNAAGGGGAASVQQLPDGKLQVAFDANELFIPSLSWRTASLLGVPIPPPLLIDIHPSRLEGTVDQATGIIELEFDALFDFSAKPLYSAPSLVVKTLLTTESVQGKIRSATGQRMDSDGNARLVGVATVEKVGDMFMDTFLMLPTDALAIMDAQFTFE